MRWRLRSESTKPDGSGRGVDAQSADNRNRESHRSEGETRRGATTVGDGLSVGPADRGSVGRRLVDPGSSLAHDDDGFIADLYAGNMVSRTAVYPIMNAIDSITSIAELIAGRTESGDSHAASLLTLSRMATESAATTIWLLSSTDRNMRRGLSVRFTASELNAQKGYHGSTRKWFEHGPLGKQSVEYQQFVEHVRLFDQRVVMLDSGKQQTPNAK
jgi:hypothetical protein